MELIAAVGCAVLAMFLLTASRRRPRAVDARRWRMGAASSIAIGALIVTSPSGAHAAVVAPVGLGTAAQFSVLGASTVTNTGNTLIARDLGVFPGSSITGFPPGLVVAPAAIHTADAVAQQAQSDLGVAYVNAAGRPVDGTTSAELADLILLPGVYSGPSRSALQLTGTVTLDGGGDVGAVFIFQTNSTLITGSGSSVVLTNGAQECNVFWQVGSSATLGTGTNFAGTIMAQVSITMTTGATMRGRTLARTGAVTLDGNTFVTPTCARAPATTTTTTSTTTTTTMPDPTTTGPGPTTTGPGPTTTGPGPTTTGPGPTTTGPGPTTTGPGPTTTGPGPTTTGPGPTTTGPGPTTTSPNASTTTIGATTTTVKHGGAHDATTTTLKHSGPHDATTTTVKHGGPHDTLPVTETSTGYSNSTTTAPAAVTTVSSPAVLGATVTAPSTTLFRAGTAPTSTAQSFASAAVTTSPAVVSSQSLPATGRSLMSGLPQILLLLGSGLALIWIARRAGPNADR